MRRHTPYMIFLCFLTSSSSFSLGVQLPQGGVSSLTPAQAESHNTGRLPPAISKGLGTHKERPHPPRGSVSPHKKEDPASMLTIKLQTDYNLTHVELTHHILLRYSRQMTFSFWKTSDDP